MGVRVLEITDIYTFAQQLIRVNNEINIKTQHFWPSVSKSIGTDGSSSQRASNVESVSML